MTGFRLLTALAVWTSRELPPARNPLEGLATLKPGETQRAPSGFTLFRWASEAAPNQRSKAC